MHHICIGALFVVVLPTAAFAQTPPEPASTTGAASPSDVPAGGSQPSARERDLTREVPILAYTYSAAGVSAKTMGAQVYGLGLFASGQDGVAGGGVAVWGSPIERLTLVVDGQRNLSRDFSPSVSAIARLYGDGREGLTLGALGKFKIDGFGKGADGAEVESELEFGGLASLDSAYWHLDANAIAGRGLGDEGEMDAEGRLRVHYVLAPWIRLGFDSQIRARVAGPLTLANGRSWDFAAGPQMLAYAGNFFGALTAGPTTMGLMSENVGMTALVSVGGTTF